MKQLDKPGYILAACGIGALLFVIGVWILSPFLMKVATAFTGLVAVATAAVRLVQTRSFNTVLLGLAALWMVLGKWILSMVTNSRIARDIMTRGQAESWETYVVLAGALLLMTLALLFTPGPGKEPATTEKTVS